MLAARKCNNVYRTRREASKPRTTAKYSAEVATAGCSGSLTLVTVRTSVTSHHRRAKMRHLYRQLAGVSPTRVLLMLRLAVYYGSVDVRWALRNCAGFKKIRLQVGVKTVHSLATVQEQSRGSLAANNDVDGVYDRRPRPLCLPHLITLRFNYLLRFFM